MNLFFKVVVLKARCHFQFWVYGMVTFSNILFCNLVVYWCIDVLVCNKNHLLWKCIRIHICYAFSQMIVLFSGSQTICANDCLHNGAFVCVMDSISHVFPWEQERAIIPRVRNFLTVFKWKLVLLVLTFVSNEFWNVFIIIWFLSKEFCCRTLCISVLWL